ncbi:hypothetical protein T492DRAFT_1118716, partial [Pavlovales sp. CCMP2436]
MIAISYRPAAPPDDSLFDQRLHQTPSYAICFAHDSKGLFAGSEDGLFAGSEDGSISCWVFRAEKKCLELVESEWKAHGGDYIANVAAHPDGDLLASMSVLSGLKLWRLREGKIVVQVIG